MLTDADRDELLIRIDERVKKLRDDMKEAKSAAGFARCQVHAAQVEDIKSLLTWGKRLIAGGVVGFIVKELWPNIAKLFN